MNPYSIYGNHPQLIEGLSLRQRLERIEQQMLDACCPFSSRYRELEEERRAILNRLKVLGVRPY